MTDRILQRYTNRKPEEVVDNGLATEIESSDDFGAFGWLRGIRDRSLSIELRKANGNIVAIPYHTIDRFEFDPSEGITLSLVGQKIRIKGRNLNAEVRSMARLFEGITRHRVPWIREADQRGDMTAANGETVIDSVEW